MHSQIQLSKEVFLRDTIFWWLLLIFRLIGYIADTLDIDSCQILKN